MILGGHFVLLCTHIRIHMCTYVYICECNVCNAHMRPIHLRLLPLLPLPILLVFLSSDSSLDKQISDSGTKAEGLHTILIRYMDVCMQTDLYCVMIHISPDKSIVNAARPLVVAMEIK